MFVTAVLVGNSDKLVDKDQSLKCPPLLPGKMHEHYDSVKHDASDLTVIYDQARQYPAFLITYKLKQWL